MCVSPLIVTNKQGKRVAVPCGKCIDCRRDFQKEWIFRLTQEMRRCAIPCFITLTYDDEHLPVVDFDHNGNVDYENGEIVEQSCLVKSDLQKFFKRLRKQGGQLMKDMRYFAVGEYGSNTNRAHYHVVIMAPNLRFVSQLDRLVHECWTFGFSLTKFCTDKQVHYVCKYMNKLDARPHPVKPFRLFSKSIGLNYLTQNVIEYYLTSFDRTCVSGSCRIGLPRYYRRKLDAISEDNYMLKKAGLKYTDLLEDVRVVEGTKYFFFKDFCDNFDVYYKHAVSVIAKNSRKYGYQFFLPTDQQVFEIFRQGNEFLQKILIESDRKIHECQIRNGLTGLQCITYENLEDI